MLPSRALDALSHGAKVVEIGVGGRFELLSALAEERPDLELVATDVRAGALAGAPGTVETVLDDATDPEKAVYEGATLLVAVRCPAELQVPIARLARHVGANLALRAFKDEWAHVDRVLGAHELASTPQGAWRLWISPR